jgi:hypothetical protein
MDLRTYSHETKIKSVPELRRLIPFLLSLKTHSAALLFDNSNDGNANGWIVVKDTGAAPAWQLINGGYEQTNDVRHYARSFYTGTYA